MKASRETSDNADMIANEVRAMVTHDSFYPLTSVEEGRYSDGEKYVRVVFGKPHDGIRICLSPEQADELAFKLGCILQEMGK